MTGTSGIQCQDKPENYHQNKSFKDPSEKESRPYGDLRLMQAQREKREPAALPRGSSSEALCCQSTHLPKLGRRRGQFLACLPAHVQGALSEVAQLIRPNHLCKN